MPLASGLYRAIATILYSLLTKEGQAKTGENVASDI